MVNFTSWPRPRYLKARGKWRRTKPRPSSERRRSGVSFGRLLGNFFGFSLTPPIALLETLTPPSPTPLPPPLAVLLEGKLEFDGAEDDDDGQSRDQWPGLPHLKQPVGAAFAFSISRFLSLPFSSLLRLRQIDFWNCSSFFSFSFFFSLSILAGIKGGKWIWRECIRRGNFSQPPLIFEKMSL